MYKKSITRIENENESSQADLSSPALHDIVATNHVVLAKKQHRERLSRACKALIIMIILAFVAIGIIVLTLVLAHSRNTLMAIVSRSAEENAFFTSNNSRFLSINQENFTTESTQTEYRQTTNTVSLTSNNLPRLTTANIHISSSSIMRTQQQSEHIFPTTQSQSTRSYPSSKIIVNEPLTTIQTTVSNQETIFLSSSSSSSEHPATIKITENQLTSTMQSEADILTSSMNNPTTTFIPEATTSMLDETSFTAYITRHFNIQTSSMINHSSPKNEQKFGKTLLDEDIMDDLLFS